MRLPFFSIPVLILSSLPALAEEPLYQSAQIGPMSPVEGITMVLLRSTLEPGAVAELYFYNADVNGPVDEGVYHVQWQDIRVTVRFFHNASAGGADMIQIIPPPGMYAEPPEVTLMEWYDKVIFIYPLGMS